MRRILYLFAKLDDQDVEWLATRGRRLELKPGAVLVHEGKPVDALSIVIDGRLQVTVGEREVASLGCGEVVGELSFLDDKPPSATVRAVEASVVLSVPRAEIRARVAQDEGFGSRFHHALGVFVASRLRATLAHLGYGAAPVEESDELGDGLLEEVALAGARFDGLLTRLRAPRATARTAR